MMPLSLSECHRRECEAVHIELARIHNDVAWGAAKRVVKALEVLHKLERTSIDLRPLVRERIAQVEKLRDEIESLWMRAGQLRSDFIRLDGCDGSCNDGYAEGRI